MKNTFMLNWLCAPCARAVCELLSKRVYCFASYLIDPVSSHMLVSKIKPCMSKYTPLYGETANGSLNQLWFIGSFPLLG